MRLFKGWAVALIAMITYIAMGLFSASLTPDSPSLASTLIGEEAHAQVGNNLTPEPQTTTAPNITQQPQDPSNLPPITQEPQDQSGDKTGDNKSDDSQGTYETCVEENGKLAFWACPILDSVAHTMSNAISDIMHQFLKVEPLKFEGPIYDTWNGVRTLANVAFVLIFVVMIMAYVLPFDLNAYTIRSILPKLVAAAILVQASYVVSAVIIDIGNVLGQGIGEIITSVANGGSAASADFSTNILIENITTIFGAVTLGALLLLALPLALPIALLVVIAVAAFIFTLAVRYFLIGMFIVVSPLAFAAWVLPNTERYFKTWLSSFIKVSLMYPIIIGLLSIAANVGGLIPVAAESGADNVSSVGQSISTSLIKILVLVAAFMAITQTFKWAGGFMNQAWDTIEDLAEKGTKSVKGSHSYKDAAHHAKSRRLGAISKAEGKLGGLMNSKNVAARGVGKGLFHAGSLVLAGHSGSSLARQRSASELVSNYAKELGDLKEADMMNQRRALLAYYGTKQQKEKAVNELKENGGEALLGYTRNLESRQAMVRRLSENNLLGPEVTHAIQGFGDARDFQMVMKENGKNLPKTPALFARYDRNRPADTNPLTGNPVVMGDINAGMAKGFLSSLDPGKIKGDDFKLDNFNVAADNTSKSSATARNISKQWSKVMGEYLPHAVQDNFDPSDRRNFMGADKRAALLKVMARNGAEFRSTVEGQRKYSEVLTMVKNNLTQHQDAIHLLEQEDDWTTIKSNLGL